MKTIKAFTLAAAVSAGLAMTSAHSATPQQHDGDLGGDSAAYFDIYLMIDQAARIWGLEEAILTGDEGINGTPEYEHSFCVFSNATDVMNGFTLTVQSDNLFTLDGVSGDSVDYTLTVNDNFNGSDSSTTGNSSFEVDLKAGLLNNQPNPSIACEAEQNVTLKIKLDQSTAVTTGSFSDRVTMTVEPI